MAYETKVMLVALARIVKMAKNLDEVYSAIEEMANSEGVVLKPYSSAEKQPPQAAE